MSCRPTFDSIRKIFFSLVILWRYLWTGISYIKSTGSEYLRLYKYFRTTTHIRMAYHPYPIWALPDFGKPWAPSLIFLLGLQFDWICIASISYCFSLSHAQLDGRIVTTILNHDWRPASATHWIHLCHRCVGIHSVGYGGDWSSCTDRILLTIYQCQWL